MTQEEKARAYDEALDRAKSAIKDCGDNKGRIAMIESIFPAIYQSEDEKIRKALVRFHKSTIDIDGIKGADILAWLEKQGNEPAWCHHKADLSDCTEEYRKAYYDGWNNCNQQHSQCDADKNDVIKCLINGMRFYYEDNKDATWGTDKWSMPVKHIIDVLEKQDNQKPTEPKPKFKVGDWVVYECGEDSATLQIKNIVYGTYEFTDDSTLNVVDEDSLRLWAIQDAKDGDVLHSPEHKLLWIYKNKEEYHAAINLSYANFVSFGADIVIPSDVHPATKEQRDMLFTKMKEAGYEWDSEKKELKKIEQKSAWSDEDEHRVEDTIYFLDTAKKHYACTILLDACIDWLKSLKQRIGG